MKNIKRLLGNYPLFFLTIPLFIIIHIEKEYHHIIVYKFVYRELIELLIAPVIFFGISFLMMRQLHKSYVFSFILMIIFFFFADLKDTLYDITPDIFISRYSFLLPLVVLICIVAYVLNKRKKGAFTKLLLYINVLFLLFITVDIIAIGLKDIKQKIIHRSNSMVTDYSPCADCFKPDIYYIIFDSYSSTGILQKEFNYDNSDVDSFLLRKNFRIIKNSRSNYNFTAYSIASCFNLTYLAGINTQIKIYANEYLPLLQTIYNSDLIPMFEKEGYKIINQSVFDFKNHPSQIPEFNVWEFETLYQRHNIFKKIDREIGWLIRSKLGITRKKNTITKYIAARDKHDSDAINALINTAGLNDKQPRFVYTHVLLPHAPFSFDSLGHRRAMSSEPVTPEKDKTDYVDQLVYTNSLLKKIVTHIFESNNRPFILIIQGDHGFKFFDNKIVEPEFANLNAIYFYNKNYHLLNDSLSNVNTFRIVFNTFFHKNYPLLKDASYFLQYK